MGRLTYTAAKTINNNPPAVDGTVTPGFFLTASCLKSAIDLGCSNYYYFASQKMYPQEIILKYTARGYPPPKDLLTKKLDKMVHDFAQKNVRWNPLGEQHIPDWRRYYDRPSITCRGFYNIAALRTEIEAFGFDK